MIEVKNLTKFYGKIKAIEDINFFVDKGEIVGLLGPNAAGKTTIMRILTCFLTPDRGTARVNGYDIFENPLEVQKSVGYLAERNPLYEELKVVEFLSFVCDVKGIRKKGEKVKKISKILEKCGLTNVRNTPIYKLSKGYKQRVGIAQALVNEPPVLILDEPTIGLDPKQIVETRNLIKELGKESTVLLSSHILPEVSSICKRVIIINEGKIVAVDSVENLTERLKGGMEINLEVEGDPEKIKKVLEEIDGVKSVKILSHVRENINRYSVIIDKSVDLRDIISARLIKNGFGILEMAKIEMTLEDVFLKLTTKE